MNQRLNAFFAHENLQSEICHRHREETHLGHSRRCGHPGFRDIFRRVPLGDNIRRIAIASETAIDVPVVFLQPSHRNRFFPFHQGIIGTVIGPHERRHVHHTVDPDRIGYQIRCTHFQRTRIIAIAGSGNRHSIGQVAIHLLYREATVLIGRHLVIRRAVQRQFRQSQTCMRVVRTSHHAAHFHQGTALHLHIQSSRPAFGNRNGFIRIFIPDSGKSHFALAFRHIGKLVRTIGQGPLDIVHAIHFDFYIFQGIPIRAGNRTGNATHALYVKIEHDIGAQAEKLALRVVQILHIDSIATTI